MVSVVVVTDSSAYLPQDVVDRYGIEVVPLYVVLAGRSGREGLEVSPADVARTLSQRGGRVSTSRPTPGDFVAAYRRRLGAGARHLVSVHLSAELSGTWDAARLAAARAAADGACVDDVVATARRTAAATRTFFVVETLEHLRRGGRLGPAAAFLGSALAVKPVLHVRDGTVVPLEKVRTSARALARLVQRAVEAAGDGPVALAVHHLAAPERAERLAAELRARLPRHTELHLSELGAAIGAHVGPGSVGVVVSPQTESLPDGGGEQPG